MTLDSLETVLLTCIFIAPGFVVDGISNAFSPNGKRNEGVTFLYCLLYSVIHCAICSWAYILTWKLEDENLTVFLLIMCVIALIGAFVLGIIIGLFKSKQWLRKLARKFKCNISHPIPSAWDFYFSKQIPSYVIVTLIDGTTIYGYFGYKSYSSSDCDERDIFIEKTFKADGENLWCDDDESLGILIHQSQIKMIEFLQGDESYDPER